LVPKDVSLLQTSLEPVAENLMNLFFINPPKIMRLNINKIKTVLFGLVTYLMIFLTSCTPQPERGQIIAQNKGDIRLGDKELRAIAITSQASEREQSAAREIINYLFRITGKHLSLINIDNTTVPEGVIAVGKLAILSGLISQDEIDSVANDGFVIKINRKNGAICGWRDLGTLYGAYELLSKLGVKYYSQDCEIIPHITSLKIPEITNSKKPYYDMRAIFKLDVYFHGLRPSVKLGYTPYDDMGYSGDLGAPEERNWVHSASFMMPYRKYGKEHPEYFALQKNGQRYKPGDGPPGHLCLSNENMRAESSKRLIMLIEKQKERSFFVVTQGDGRSDCWCQCNSCKALDAERGNNMTDRLLQYVNYNAGVVAKKYPGKKILTLAYTEATSRPPKKILPESNVMVMYCPYPPQTMCQSHGLDCPENKIALEELKGWLSKCPDNMYIFDYPRGYNTWYEPFGSFYAMVSKMNFYSSVGIRGVIDCVVPTNFSDLFIFVQGRLFWDPKADVEALIDEFMVAYYGPAAPAIRDYFNFMHHEIDSRPVHQMCEGPNPELVTSEYADKALKMFKTAQAAVANDSVRLRRVEVEKFCVLWSDLDQRNTVNNKLSIDLDEHIQRFGEMIRIARDMKIIKVKNGDKAFFKDWVRSVAPLWLQSEPWYEDPAVDILIAQPANLFKY